MLAPATITPRPTPAERLHAAIAASWQDAPPRCAKQPLGDTRPEVLPAPSPRCARHLAKHTSDGITRTWLQSQEKSLLRELDNLTKGLAAVRQQLATLPTS